MLKDNLKSRIVTLGVSQARIARYLGATPSQMSIFLRGKGLLNLHSLEKAMDRLDLGFVNDNPVSCNLPNYIPGQVPLDSSKEVRILKERSHVIGLLRNPKLCEGALKQNLLYLTTDRMDPDLINKLRSIDPCDYKGIMEIGIKLRLHEL